MSEISDFEAINKLLKSNPQMIKELLANNPTFRENVENVKIEHAVSIEDSIRKIKAKNKMDYSPLQLDYIKKLPNSDDFIDFSMIDFLKSELEDNDVLLSICGHEKYPSNTSQKNIDELNRSTLKINDSKAFEFILDNQELCAPWAKMYDASLFKDLRFPITRNEDMFLTPQIFKEVRYLKSSGITAPDLDTSIRTSLKLNNIPEKPSLN
jgi:hypothetical protein